MTRPPESHAQHTEARSLPDDALFSAGDSGHASVLLREVVEALRPRPGGYTVIDCTTNGGGHAAALLERSNPDGQLYGLDADAAALARAEQRLAPFGDRVHLVHSNFRHLAQIAAEQAIPPVDGILFDLGLSSVQLDSSGRGFSLRFDEPLDMRFAPDEAGPTAADLLNELPEAELEHILRAYGEELRARRVAQFVGRRRQQQPFARTVDLVEVVTRALGGARGRIHPATRVFQALRIAVNDELGALEAGLDAALALLKPGGRLAVISFHSLEDRIVKWRFRAWAGQAGADAVHGAPLVHILTRKPTTPQEDEVQHNPRARSAKLRVAERLALTGGAA